jgi:glycosyltransferase involved in cell wall biosynthesis
MKNLLKGFIGADRPKIIAVIGITRDDVEAAVDHARTASSGLPLWAWCVADAEPVKGCERFIAKTTASDVREGLRSVWPALLLVAWTGKSESLALKLLPFTIPPFRFVVFNEARGFFTARPASLARHAGWRMRNAVQSIAARIADWTGGAGSYLYSLGYRGAEHARDIVDLGWNYFLAILAFLARCTPRLVMFAIQHFGGQGSSAEQPPLRDLPGSYRELRFSNRGWSRRTVVRAVRDTDADFIVFRRHGEHASAEPLIEIARQSNAFAVARQSAWAGWTRRAIPKHPFRRLQPGEVTQVLAPYSTLIVIRRDLLLRFGVPHALTYGAALMILFRKAAGAGFESLVTGCKQQIAEQPEMELEDAEFALRLALSSELRRTGPVHSLRSRGNLSWSFAECRGMRRKPRVLIVSPYLPFPLSHGGAVRMYNLCRAMSQDIDFVLACFREADDTVEYAALHEVFREVYILDADEKYADPGVPAQVAEYRNSAMAGLIRRLCLARKVDVVQLEYTQMAEYRDCTGAVPVILVEHDITFTLHRQIAESMPQNPVARKQYELWLAFEREALQCSNAVWTMSERDREIACEYGASRRNTVVVPNGVDLRRFQPARRQNQERILLFVGSFRHLPNLLAFESLCATVMPEVWRSRPDVKLQVIAGPHHERAVAAAGKQNLLDHDPRIAIQGFVPDVRPAYRECDVVVIPLPISAGTNIKLMEAMACGRAVVSTAVGCQGLGLLDGSDLLIRESGPEFARAVTCLLGDDYLRQTIATAARRTAEQRFGWDAISRKALASYEAHIEHPAARAIAAGESFD